MWGWVSYDPELDLIYYGTANPGPWNHLARPGDNEWTAGVFARSPETGQARWFYQFSHHDLFDYDGINEMVLLDLPIGGQPRKVLVHPEPSIWPFLATLATGAFFVTAIFTAWGVVVGAVLLTVAFIGWGWPREKSGTEPDAEVAA